MKQILLSSLIVVLLFSTASLAQNNNIGIGTSTPDASAMLEILSNDKGLLVPRMTAAERQAIVSPANALLVYDTDSACFLYYKLPTTTWINLCAEFAETDPEVGANTANQIPKWDGSSLIAGSIADSAGKIGIGTSVPAYRLEVLGTGIGISNTSADGTKKIGTYVDNNSAYIQTHSNDPLRFATNNGLTQMILTTNGNVGIGSTSPTQKLDVNGKLRVRDVTNDNTKDSVLVVSGDGTVSYRDASTITGGVTTYSIGDFAHGGIVFWVDETGQHGLVCAKSDQSSAMRWYAGTNGNTQAKGDGPFSGEANTSIIISSQVAIGDDNGNYAARLCNELQITEGGYTYGDWYLPSRYELNLMYVNRAAINATATVNGGVAFANDGYWSSTEVDNLFAWGQVFGSGYQINYFKNFALRVHAVRAF